MVSLQELRDELDAINGLEEPTEADLARRNELMKQIEEAEFMNQGIPFNVEGVDFTNLPVEFVKLVEKIVMFDRRRIAKRHNEQMEKLEQQMKGIEIAAEERELQLKRQNEELQERLKECEEVALERGFEIDRLKHVIDDLESKRQAAANKIEEAEKELAEAKDEIIRLKSQIDDYQKAKVFGESEAQKIIDVTENEAEEIQQLVETIGQKYKAAEDWGSVVKVTLENGDIKLVKRSELATMQPTDDAVVPKGLFPGDVMQFFPEGDGKVSDPIEPPSFRVPHDTSGVSGIQSEADAGDNRDQRENGAEISLEERVKALEEWKKQVNEILSLDEKGVA